MSAFAFRVTFILVCVWGTSPGLSGPSLDCTNDLKEEMSCCVRAPNCSERSLALSDDSDGEKRCAFQERDAGRCCCSVHMTVIFNNIHNATVWKGDEYVESKHINVTASIKPKAPTIVSLRESNGNFQLMWRTNTNSTFLDTTLSAIVTYAKKGSAEKVTKPVGSTTVNGLKYYEIPGRDLEPSTTYVVSVRSHISWSGKDSDSSQEEEFTTAAASHVLGIVVALSAAAVLITAAALGCFYRIRAGWLDAVTKCPKPKLVDMHPGMDKGKPVCNILKPLATEFSLVSVDPASPDNSSTRSGSAGAGAGPSPDVEAGVQEALSRALAHIGPSGGGSASAPYSPCGVGTDFDNMSYLSGLPCCPGPLTTGSSEAVGDATI